MVVHTRYAAGAGGPRLPNQIYDRRAACGDYRFNQPLARAHQPILLITVCVSEMLSSRARCRYTGAVAKEPNKTSCPPGRVPRDGGVRLLRLVRLMQRSIHDAGVLMCARCWCVYGAWFTVLLVHATPPQACHGEVA